MKFYIWLNTKPENELIESNLKLITYISFIVLIIFISSCKQDNETKKVAEYFRTQNSTEKLVTEIDFSKSDSALIKSIEKQLKVDLCDENSWFMAKMNFKNTQIEFPAYANKNCNWNTVLHNIIPMTLNSKNQALISTKIVDHNTSIENKVISATKEKINGTQRKSIIYSINWDTKLDTVFIKQRVFETLKAIKSFSNDLALKNYNKDISELTEEELIELKKEFTGIVGFNGYFAPPLPPPPEMKIE